MSLYDQLLDKMNGKQYSSYFVTFCPFHENRNSPALFVYEDDGRYRCASCGAKGSIQYLAKKIGSHFSPELTQRQKSNILPRWKKWEQEYGNLEGIVAHAHKSLLKFHQIDGYLKKRRIYEFVEKGNLGVTGGWLIIPTYDCGGKLVDVVARGINKGVTRYVVSPQKNGLRPLYVPNWGIVQASQEVYVVYGIVDAISLCLLGFPVITGLTGQSLSAELLKPLGKRFIIIPDRDEERSAHKLANSLGWRAKVKELDWLDGTKDCNDVLMKYGKEQLVSLLH